MELSIIIPIYNTDEAALIKCFESIKSISKIKYECLLIDDGSQEKTGSFCREYADANESFRYFRKENGGVSSARNWGIRLANGRYVCFVDSDDIFAHEAYNDLDLSSERYDIIFTDLVKIDDRKYILWKAFDEPGEISYEMAIEHMVTVGNLNGPYCKLIKRKYLEKTGVLFRENMIQAEDAVFFYDLLSGKPKMNYLDKVSYYYVYMNENGHQRFVNHPKKCIINAIQHYSIAVQSIKNGAFSENEKRKLLIIRKENHINGIFSKVLDGIMLNINLADIQDAVQTAIITSSEEPIEIKNVGTKLKESLLAAPNWTTLKYIEKVRAISRQIKRKISL